jgi:hypothetical protein
MDFHLRGDRSRKHNYRDAHSTKSLWRCTSEGSLVVAALCASFSGIGASDPITVLLAPKPSGGSISPLELHAAFLFALIARTTPANDVITGRLLEGGPQIMAARLGNVLCWLGCIIDAVVVLSVVAVVVADNTYTPEQRPYAIGLAVVLGAIPMGIGRALRYILAGT